MKRWLLLLAALLMLQYVPAYAERIHTYAAVNEDKVNVRQKPGGKISEQLNRGTWVYILEEKKQSDRTWCRIAAESPNGSYRSGWMAAEYLTPLHDAFSDVVQAAAGRDHVALLHRGGTVSVAGMEKAHLAEAETWTDIRQITMGRYHLAGVTNQNRVRYASRFFSAKEAEGWRNIREATAQCYNDYLVGITADGRTVSDWHGDPPLSFPSWPDAVQRFYGEKWNAYLTADGIMHVVRECQDIPQALQRMDGLTGVAQFAAAEHAAACLMRDGTVRCFAEDPRSAIGTAETWTDVRQIAMGDGDFVLGLKADGTVRMAGTISSVDLNMRHESRDIPVNLSDTGELDAWTDIVSIAAGPLLIVGVHSDGTAEMLGAFRYQ